MDLFSDSDNFSESSGSEEQDDMERFYGGHACSILSSLEETIGKIDDFLSFERGFVHGDVVRPTTDPSGQMGKVVDVRMFVDLENSHGKVIKELNSRKLRKVRSLSVGDYVVLGPWLGKVHNIADRVTILFDDGTKSEFIASGPEKIIPIPPDLLEDSQYPYYPGQRVRVELSTVPKSAKWLCGTRNEKDEGTVLAVEAGYVYVDWLACALVGPEKAPMPPFFHDSKILTSLSCFSHTNWQLGDWCLIPDADVKGFDLIKGNKHSNKVNPNFNEMFVIVKTRTIVDVTWQDGSTSTGLDSRYLVPVNFVDAHDFCPGQFVVEKGNCDDPQVPSGRKWGVVRCVDAKEKTVAVIWGSELENQDSSKEEIVSAYELAEHPDYSYCLGDVIFRLERSRSADEGDHGAQNAGLEVNYQSSIGIVVGFKAGKVAVKWVSGDSEEVAPDEILRMDKYEGSSFSHVLHGESAQQLTREMTEHEMKDSGARSLPQAAIGIFTGIIGRLLGSPGPASSLTKPCQSASDNEDEELESVNLRSVGPVEINLAEQAEYIEQDGVPLPLLGSNYPDEFIQFDIVRDCSDHHFFEVAGKGLESSQVRKGWLKRVQKEWSIFKNGLPETIYVRAYEERMELVRAAIVGAPGTPYHDGLFFFDIFLPSDYPHEPPLVHYNSGGMRVNPNLYESGKVCLSLLNTWTGTETEVWNPESSTILQVLLSLQALVLNEKPYFNEAGYDKQMGRAEGEKNSNSYNENAFLVSCKSMLYLLRKPPKHFEAFVEEHFKQHSGNILSACKAYMEGAPVGCTSKFEKHEHENQQGSSTGFKIMLSKLYPKLVEAFTHRGADCSLYVD